MRTTLLLLLLCLHGATALAAPRVVTSIAPLQEITAAIMAGIASPDLIITAQASMHHFAFRPSHMRHLQAADLVIWVDRHFEAGFNRVAEILPDTASQLEILPALDIDSTDGHVWYSPGLLRQSIDIIATRLARLDPEHRAGYHDNAAKLSAEVADWRAATHAWLQDHQPRFITDHAFTTHFEADLGYSALATIHDQHDGHGGLGELNRIEELLRQYPTSCLLTLESSPSPLALELARKYRLNVINLTPPAAVGGTETGIIERLQILSNALKTCS
ncbi:MAG: zinc ABC transporter substrate-binding protein [Gammaproteobacteria bacterium]|nr:zinc ABC transporter substrate-binding protein [Gammaproteobacteria bacterium]